MLKQSALAIVAGLFTTACVTVSGPSVTVLPGQGKSFEQFQADDAVCRQRAAGQAGETTQPRYDMTYVQCMYAKGHKIPVAGGSPYTSGSSSQPAAQPPANIPPPP